MYMKLRWILSKHYIFRLYATPDEYKHEADDDDDDDDSSLVPLTEFGKEMRRKIRASLGLQKKKNSSAGSESADNDLTETSESTTP